MSIKQFKNGGLIPLAGLNSFTDMSDVDGLLDGKQNVLTFDDAPTDGSSNPVTSDGIYDALANLGAGLLSEVQNNMLSGKQDVLTFDSTPTEGSSNPVTSDGIKQAIDDAISSSGGGGGSGGSGSSVKLYDTFGQNTDGAINQKVVSDALDAKANQSALDALSTAISGKQDTLTFDSTPTEGSSNPVTSDGIKTALDSKQNALTFDDTPTEGSVNPVTSDGLFSVLGAVSAALDGINNGEVLVTLGNATLHHYYNADGLEYSNTRAWMDVGTLNLTPGLYLVSANCTFNGEMDNPHVMTGNILDSVVPGGWRSSVYADTGNTYSISIVALCQISESVNVCFRVWSDAETHVYRIHFDALKFGS